MAQTYTGGVHFGDLSDVGPPKETYMSSSPMCADPSFGVKAPALAIMALLSQTAPDFAEWDAKYQKYLVKIQTFPWYNGREKGVCLMVQRHTGGTEAFCVTFGECRGSDRIFVEGWEQPEPFNQPTVEERERVLGEQGTEDLYQNRKTFSRKQLVEVSDHVYSLMAAWYKAVTP
jgi:hypothetical protein